MNRRVVAGVGLLSLALTGCAQSRSAMPQQGSNVGPVGLSALPSIHEAINQDNPKFDSRTLQSELRESALAQRSEPDQQGQSHALGQVQAEETAHHALAGRPRAEQPGPSNSGQPDGVLSLSQPGMVNGTTEGEGAPTSASANPVSNEAFPGEMPEIPSELARDAGLSTGPSESVEPGEALTASDVNSLPLSVENDGPTPLSPRGDLQNPESGRSAGDSSPVPVVAAPTLPGETVGPESNVEIPVDRPAPSDPSMPEGGIPPLPADGDQPSADGPDMPSVPPIELPPPPEVPQDGSGKDPVEVPVDVPTDPNKGSASSEAGQVPVVPAPKLPSETQESLGEENPKSSSTSAVGQPIAPEGLPPLEPAPVELAQVTLPDQGSATKTDADVTRTASNSSVMKEPARPRTSHSAGSVAARVGNEVITRHELNKAVQTRLHSMNLTQAPTEEELGMLAFAVLQEMVERSLIVQEAKREIKSPEHLAGFSDNADQTWKDEELGPLLRKHSVTNEYELKQKLKELGISLEDIREDYRRQFLSQGYMRAKLGPKLFVSLPELQAYYQAHLREYDRPAQITWREIAITFSDASMKGQARAKIESILNRLRQGEDFAKVAAAETEGPNRNKGGVWETAPGSYAVDAVNAAIESLPLNQISQVIEGPASYHLVRVENRRPAGPIPFSDYELQSRIRTAIMNEKIQRESATFLTKLRKQTIITTMFDNVSFSQPEGR